MFTDIDCGFCRKLHSEMARYNEEGIRIRYLFYPRAGIGSESYKKAVSVWCADDRKAAMDKAKAGQEVQTQDLREPGRGTLRAWADDARVGYARADPRGR